MNRIFSQIVIAAVLALPAAVQAAQDESQRMLVQQVQQAKQKLAAAQAAQGSDRQKLMAEHMTMMQKTMGQMQGMMPGGNMTPQERAAWMTEHQKLMDTMVGQMMDEHRLMMQMNCK